MEAEDKRKPIKVFARVRPLNEEEVERHEKKSVETFEDSRKIKIIDERHSQETTYYFDGVFSGEDSNKKVFQYTTRHLLTKFLNGMNCAVLTYGQTGSGKTFTLMADGCITEYAIKELFEKIGADKIHKYKISCSFVQVYLEKVYDLLGTDDKKELPVREHPKNGIYVANLTHHRADTAEDVFTLLERGKLELVTAETKMVRQSSRSHSIFQLSIERRLDVTKKRLIANADDGSTEVPHLCVPDDIIVLEEDMVLRGKMDICDLAGSERIGKTMVEGINRSEARYINSSLLELGNVIYALSEGKRRHIPFRNSTLTRLLQECLGSRCQTSFIVCIAPSASEAYETRCSLNFGTRARTITNKERMCMNVEVDYKLLARKLSRKIEILENELNVARPIREFISTSLQNLNNAVETQTDFVYTEKESTSHTAPSLVNILQCKLTVSEMLDILLENNENLNQQHDNVDTLRSSAMMGLFTMATKIIISIQNNLAGCEYQLCMDINEVHLFLENCLQKLEHVRMEVMVVDGNDKNDLFCETAYTISEACSDIENILGGVVKADKLMLAHRDKEHGPTETDLYKTMNDVMILFQEEGPFKDNQAMILYICNLITLLQVLQISRLLLESSRLSSNQSANSSSSKPCSWSTSVEEGTSSDVGNTSNEDTYLSDYTITTKGENLKDRDYFPGRINPPFKGKLNRRHSFKIKPDQQWKNKDDNLGTQHYSDCRQEITQAECDAIAESPLKLNRRKSKVQSLDYPRTQTKRYVFIEDGMSRSMSSNVNDLESYELKYELADLENRHEELCQKYQNMSQQKETLAEKLKKSQHDKMVLMTERDYAQQQVEALLNEQRERDEEREKDEGNHRVAGSEGAALNVQFLEELNTTGDDIKREYETLLEEKENEIKHLVKENQRLVMFVGDGNYGSRHRDIVEKFVVEKQQATEDVYKQANFDVGEFAEEVLMLCNALDVVNYHDSVRKSISNIEDINQLESELFSMIESNVRYEAALVDIRDRANKILNGDEQVKSADETCTKKVDTTKIAPKIITTHSPIHVTKKMMNMKKVQRKRLEELRKSGSQQPVSMAKEIKGCRTNRVKELLQEKLKLSDHIEKLNKDLLSKETKLREASKQIELLVTELGHLDIELHRQKSNVSITREKTTIIKENVTTERVNKKCVDVRLPVCENEDIAIIKIPEIQYDDFVNIVNNHQHLLTPTADKQQEEMVPVSELESMKLEAETYRRKYKNLEHVCTGLKENDGKVELLNQTVSLQHKNEYLEETNHGLMHEIKAAKALSHDRKLKIQELRERNNTLIEELEQLKRQSIQTISKCDNAKVKLEKKLAHFKEKISTLENHSQKLQDELFVLKKNNEAYKSFNDSGLAQSQDSEYLISI